MTILVDTSVWSLAFRRPKPADSPEVTELQELIREARVQLIGPIRQEILSGIRERSQFLSLQAYLRAFPDLRLDTADFERAAELFNICRGRGVQGSNYDFLLCAVSDRHGMPILTTDRDFENYARHISISLHQPREPRFPA